MADDFSKDWRQARYQEERGLRAFRDRLEDRWGEGLDALRILLEVSRQLGEQAHQRLEWSKARRGKAVRSTLIRLHIRACQIGAEILALLENGFADGALARWRTLHEVTIVALLISDADDDDLAIRYLDHEIVESKKALDRFLIDHADLGFRAPTNSEVERAKRKYAKILSKHGSTFRHQYGWAANLLGIDRPRFIDLQVAAGKSSMHSHYKMASYNVHATPKALTQRIGSLNQNSILIAGASNAGLEEAGIKLASTLALITYALPSGKYRIDHAITLSTVANLRDKAIENLITADRVLRADDRNVRRAIQKFETGESST